MSTEPTGEKHIISTIEQLADIANVENMERLLFDISAAIRLSVAARIMYPEWKLPHIEWTDDGVSGISGFSVTRNREENP